MKRKKIDLKISPDSPRFQEKLISFLLLGRHLLDGRGSLLALLGDDSSALFLVPQSDHASVLSSLLAGLLSPATLDGLQVPLVLESPGGNETLDLGDLVVGLTVLLKGPADGGLGDGVALLQLEELPDLGSPLGTQPDGVDNVGQTREILVTLLDDDDVQDGEISTDDATTDRPPPAVTITLGDEAVGV